MDLKDLDLAIEDMIKCHDAKESDIVHIVRPDGTVGSVTGIIRGKDGKLYIY